MQKKKELFDEVYKEQPEFCSISRLQTGAHVIGRMLYLCTPRAGERTQTKEESAKIVATELCKDWIAKNVYPKKHANVTSQIIKDWKTFHELCKRFKQGRETKDFLERVSSFNERMTGIAYDIKTECSVYQKKLEDEHGVKMTNEDFLFYQDNCHGSYTAKCTETVPANWKKQEKRKGKRLLSEAKTKQKLETEPESQREDSDSSSNEVDQAYDKADPEFTPSKPKEIDVSSATRITPKLRSENTPKSAILVDRFPKVPVRNGRRSLNENVVRCTVQCLASYKVSRDDLAGIIVNVANTIFGQSWKAKNEFEDDVDDDYENDDSEEKNNASLGDGECLQRKRRRSANDLTYVFPSARCIDKYLQDAAFLNLKAVADAMIEKEENDVVTVGFDDFTKAAGYGTIHGKADHITIKGPNKKKTVMTTGFIENIGHTGAEGAEGYNYKLKCLAILGNCEVSDLKSSIDFWMSDRAGDCETFLQELEIEEQKIIKCCAHLILGVDHACDKVFKDTEQKVGVHKLLNLNAGEKAFSSGSSVHTLGQIAIAKLLSPSHASHSVSLFNEFKQWLELKGEKTDFRGFVANRFGRIAENARQFVSHKDLILEFFDEVVDQNSNKLVLAVSNYIQNEWFIMCSDIYSMIGSMLIFPMMTLFGIDSKKGGTKHEEPHWTQVREFFKEKLKEIDNYKIKDDSAHQKLLKAILQESHETLQRQLSCMSFFQSAENSNKESDYSKLMFAPISNLGCESEIAWLDNRLKFSGGSTSVSTISNKKVIHTNKAITSELFPDDESERRKKWKWARSSDEVKAAKALTADFLQTVRSAKQLSLKKKAELKLKKDKKTFQLLENCKAQGGPVTPASIDIIESFSSKELLNEVAYLRSTISPNIRQQRRVKVDGKIRIQKFTNDELKAEIRNSVKPKIDDINTTSLNDLVNAALNA